MPRHIPMRTCVGCRTVKPKQAMMRIVRTADGTVEIDPTGKKPGRGAYLCLKRSCWQTALRRKSLNSALKVPLKPEEEELIRRFAEILPEEELVGLTWKEKAELLEKVTSAGGVHV